MDNVNADAIAHAQRDRSLSGMQAEFAMKTLAH